MEPVGVGTRWAAPMSLPLSSGRTRPIALAAPVSVGDDVDGAGAATTLVALALRAVERHLVASPGVNGGHDAGHDGSQVVQTLGHQGRGSWWCRKQRR